MPFPATHPALQRALHARDYATPTQVQEAVLDPASSGRDLLVSAQTGSGKTVAFGLALGPLLLQAPVPAAAPLALVIAPTRELALQVQGELAWLYAETGLRCVACVGGTDARREARALASGCGLVVGTPGRLRDHVQRGQLDLGALHAVVLDEADEMLDMGFREDLEALLDATPPGRRTLLFSATIPREIASLARRYQQDPLRIDTIDRHVPHADIEYRALRIAPGDATGAVVNVLRYFEPPSALVFCATREAVRALHASLAERGFAAVALSGELSQAERTGALQALRDGRARVCVATDVAARGLDLPELGLVVHADLPVDRAALLHRSGRTGRAGRKGLAVLLVASSQRRRAEALLTAAGVAAAWGEPPSASDIRAADQQRLLDSPILAAPPDAEDHVLVQALLAGRTPEALAAALIRLHRAGLPAPADLSRAAAAPPQAGRGARPAGAGVWFSLAVGRREHADPKWLVPLICRQGAVTKQDIGAIRIFDQETLFEIAADAAAGFAATLPRGGGDPRIAPAGPAPERRAPKRGYHRAADAPRGRPAPRHRTGTAG
jgi:ATP-dependent RNA helicase DeaD